MAEYKLTGGGAVLRVSDGSSIPPDPANRDYAQYLVWLADGNTPDPYIPPTPPVPTITKAQALLYLLMIGKTEADVESELAKIADPRSRAIATIEWEHRQPFHYDHQLFVEICPRLGITDRPAAFRIAATL